MKRYPEPARPAGLPDAAVWNAKENEWELGQHSPDGKEIGEWLWWYPDGTMVCHAIYNDEGQLHGPFKRFHPNGEISQWAEWTNGKVHGSNSWTRPTSGPSDKSSVLPPNLADHVMCMSVPYDNGRPQQYHFTLYTIDGMHNPVPHDEDGRSIELGSHLWRVAAETTLFLLEPYFEDIQGNMIHNDSDEKARWIYDGQRQSSDVFGVRFVKGSKTQIYEVDGREMSRAFTLSSDYYLASLKEKRPANVPENAIWNLVESTWEMGETHEKRKVGLWKVWDKVGRLRRQETYSKYGVLHGDYEYDYPDGSPAIRARYYKGEIEESIRWRRDDTEIEFPYEVVETIKRVESRRDGAYLYHRHFLEDGTETNRHGVSITDAFEDAVFDIEPESYLEERFLGPGQTSQEQVFEWPFPTVNQFFNRVFEAVSEHGERPFRHWIFESEWGSYWSPTHFSALLMKETPPNLNRFDCLIENLRYGRHIDLQEIFCGVISLGRESRAGVFFFLDIFDGGVWVQDARQNLIQGRIASDLASFVYLQSALEAHENLGTLSGEGLRKAIQRVEGRCFAMGPFQGVIQESHETQRRRQEKHPRELRAKWIIELLAGTSVDEAMQYVDEWPDLSEMVPARCATDASEAVYWMWRLFFVSDSERLEGLVAELKRAQFAMIRDAALQMDEILWGREPVGNIEDIYELRAEISAALPDAPKVELEVDEEDANSVGQPKAFSWYLKRLSSWSHDSEIFWNIAMNVERATPEERKTALAHFEPLQGLGPLNMPMARFALKRLGGDVDDVRLWVRSALAKELNPKDAKSGEWQKIWALRIAGEDESVEVDVLMPWVNYPHEPIQEAAREALKRRAPEVYVAPLLDLKTSTADEISDAVETMLSTWTPFSKDGQTPSYLIQALERLQEMDDLPSFIRTARVCLEHSEPAIFEAALRVLPPWDATLVEAMTRVEETATGWAAQVARRWLKARAENH